MRVRAALVAASVMLLPTRGAADMRVFGTVPASPAAVDGSVTAGGADGDGGADVAGAGGVAGDPAAEPPRVRDRLHAGHDDAGRYLDLTGFVQPGYIQRFADENAAQQDSTFWLQRARIGLRARVAPFVTVRMELELAPTPNLQDAYVELGRRPVAKVRVGQFLVPFLLAFQFNELRLGFLDRPIYAPLGAERPFIRFLSPRDIGGMVHGDVGGGPNGRRPTLRYAAGVFLGRGANQSQNTDEAFLYAARLQVHALGLPEGADHESDLARNRRARVAFAGGFYSNCDDRTNWNRGFTSDLEARYRGLYLSASVLWFRSGPSEWQSKCRGSYQNSSGEVVDFVSRGAHASAQYVLPKSLLPGDHEVEILARYDIADPVSPHVPGEGLLGGGAGSPNYVAPVRINDSDNAPTQYRLTFGLNYYPNGDPSLRVSLNYQLNREVEALETSAGTLLGVRNDALWLQLTTGL